MDNNTNLNQDPNPFIGEFACTACGHVDKRINEFPKGRCLDCHEKSFNSQPAPTATEIADMFRNVI